MLSFVYLTAKDSFSAAKSSEYITNERELTFVYHGQLNGYRRCAYHIFGASNNRFFNYFKDIPLEKAFPEEGQLYIVKSTEWISITLQELKKHIFLLNLNE